MEVKNITLFWYFYLFWNVFQIHQSWNEHHRLTGRRSLFLIPRAFSCQRGQKVSTQFSIYFLNCVKFVVNSFFPYIFPLFFSSYITHLQSEFSLFFGTSNLIDFLVIFSQNLSSQLKILSFEILKRNLKILFCWL